MPQKATIVVAVLLCITAAVCQGRQMCLSCQYQDPLESGFPCVTDPWNWPGGNFRARCETDCEFEFRQEIKTKKITYAYRGCTTPSEMRKNGCTNLTNVNYCYFSCFNTDYCNAWNLTTLPAMQPSSSAAQIGRSRAKGALSGATSCLLLLLWRWR